MHETMMLAACMAAFTGAQSWFGPASVSFDNQVGGNPYSGEVTAVFKNGDQVEKRPAYYDGAHWNAVLVAHSPGAYSAHLEKEGAVLTDDKKVVVKGQVSQGFVRLGGTWGFQFDNGENYWPIGHDLAWGGGGVPPLPDDLRQMKTYGANWARIWATHFDGRNPWWHKATADMPAEAMDQAASKQWDDIVKGAEEGGVHFQFVLFHHGCFSSNVNTNWPENPWNKANGGWLAKPDDFFTDPKARALAKAWLRYAVARWGYSNSIMSWELFNEVEWCDASRNNPAAVNAWHKEMSDYLRSIDPYHHLITTSSRVDAGISPAVDYYQPHGYPPSVGQMVAAFQAPTDHPAFYGEVGPGDNGQGDEHSARQAIRDAIYESLFHRHAGSAQYWYWDKVYALKLQNEWTIATKEIANDKPLDRPAWKPTTPQVIASAAGSLTVSPGGGWEAFKQYDYNLPADSQKFGGFSAYFQGTGHKEMRTKVVTLKFNSMKTGPLTLRIDEISGSGGTLVIKVNGATALQQAYPGGDQTKRGTVSVQIPMGHDTVVIDNIGPDWIKIGAISVPGIGMPVMADGAGDGQIELLRATRTNAATDPFELGGLNLPDGNYTLTMTNLDTGNPVYTQGQVKSGKWDGKLDYKAQDMLLRFEPRAQ